MAAARTFKTRIDLPANRREELIALLNQHLADTFDLYPPRRDATLFGQLELTEVQIVSGAISAHAPCAS